ncbi:MAG: nucleotidyl transferase AbiEii/AbiGii toxin family protein, partial [Muribaculaceae bacterium]
YRMSRHIYDLERLMDDKLANEALNDRDLYLAVIEHRKKFIGLKGFDYTELLPQNISFVPPVNILDRWKSDYETMQISMIYGNSLPFYVLIARIKELNERFRKLKY